MRRRRFIQAGVTAALAAGLGVGSAGCSKSSAGNGSGEITYWLWQDDPTEKVWQDLVREFNESQPDVTVTLETIPLDQYQNQLVTAIMNGSGPDAARCKDWWVGQFAPEGAIADLSSKIDSWDAAGDVIESLWDTGRLPGAEEVYMLPHQYTTLYLYYRKDYFAKAGLEPPHTQADFLSAAQALTGDKRYAMDVRGGAGGQDQWLAWMYAGGAEVVDDGGEVVLDNDVAVSVNQVYLDIVTKLDAAPPGSITADFAAVKTNFADGLTAMMIHHPGSLKELQEHFGDKLGVIPIPAGDSQPGTALGSMSGNVIIEGSKNADAAWTWISWLSEKDPMTTMCRSARDNSRCSPRSPSWVITPTIRRSPWRWTRLRPPRRGRLLPGSPNWPARRGIRPFSGPSKVNFPAPTP